MAESDAGKMALVIMDADYLGLEYSAGASARWSAFMGANTGPVAVITV
jgi:hypothetical protein